ncbi:flagellar filament capping protein FliD [Pseudokineococcus basanitobsidens]|uniref:Flagellar hook-associated protein 2 n=1 Tax=Pseudokineococcus basanitobsidens TaxID=1926649 RepID=A0ABU8RG93_9ACTN
MAGGLSISGLSSGLDTKTIISQLMSVEALSQTRLKSQVTAFEKQISALQSINTRFSSITAAAAKVLPTTSLGVSTPGTAWTATTATSSSPSVTATAVASADARPGAVRFEVLQVAAAHSVVSGSDVAADATVVSGPPYEVSIEFPNAGTDAVRLMVGGNGTIRDVAAAINGDADLGMRATVLQVSPGQYRLQVSSSTTGSAGQFELTGLEDALGEEVLLVAGDDAEIDLGGGFRLRSATGSFDDLLPGVSIRPTTASPEAVTVTVTKDATAATTAAKNLVESVNTALAEMRSQSAATPATTSGGTSTKGPLAGDAVVRGTIQSLLSAVTGGGVSTAPAGVQLTREGTLAFDEAAFAKLSAEDPARAQALVTGLAERLSAVAKATSDPVSGAVTTAITGRRSTVKDLGEQVDRWDTRLELRRATLERQFAALEPALANLQAQSTYLAGQIAGLPSWSS